MAIGDDSTDNLGISAKIISELAGAVSSLDQHISNMLKTSESIGGKLVGSFGGQALRSAETFKNTVEEVKNTFGELIKHAEELDKLSVNPVVKTEGMGRLTQSVDILSDKMIKLGQFVSNSNLFDKFSQNGVTAISTINTALDGFENSLKSVGLASIIPAGVMDKINLMANNATQAENLENTFLSLSGATGDLGDVYAVAGTKLQNLSDITANYVKSIENTAMATGFSVRETSEFAGKLGTIPGIMTQTVNLGRNGEERVSGLAAAMKLMSGSGQSLESVQKALTTAYENLGNAEGKVNDATQKGAQFFALMSEASQNLHLRFSDVEDMMNRIADSFRFIGNESDGAVRILERYSSALQETGLTSKASIDITNQMVDSIEKLSVGTKAFLSLRSGGPGGLQGAFKIDEMLREGKIDQVMQMMERNLRQQFGGRIYSMKEASESPEAAAQFYKQQQLVKSGAFGSLVDTDAKAARLLEALQKGDLGAMKSITTGQDALAKVSQNGNDIQERNFNELKRANISLEMISAASIIQAGKSIRETFGAEGSRGFALNNLMKGAEQNTGREFDKTKTPENVANSLIRMFENAVPNLASSVYNVGKQSGKGMFSFGEETIGEIQNMLPKIELGKLPATANIPQNINIPFLQNTTGRREDIISPRDTIRQATSAAVGQISAPRTDNTNTRPTLLDKEVKVHITVDTAPGLEIRTESNSNNSIVEHMNAANHGARSIPR